MMGVSNLEGMIMSNLYTPQEELLVRKLDEAVDFLQTDRLPNLLLNIDAVTRAGEALMTEFGEPVKEQLQEWMNLFAEKIKNPESLLSEKIFELDDKASLVASYIIWQGCTDAGLETFVDVTKGLEAGLNKVAAKCVSWDMDNGRWVDVETATA
jgi:hypothetical protein